MLVTTDVARLTARQRRELAERLEHWLPVLSPGGGPLTIRMAVRVAGDEREACRRAGSVIKRLLADMQIVGRVVTAEVAE